MEVMGLKTGVNRSRVMTEVERVSMDVKLNGWMDTGIRQVEG